MQCVTFLDSGDFNFLAVAGGLPFGLTALELPLAFCLI